MTTFPVPDPDVDLVLPCLNEAGALPWVLSRIPPGWRALVVDNGSTDGSAELARGLGATVVREERRGFGAACHAGLTAATADIVCFCDCDGSLDPALLLPFVDEVRAGEADLVLGRRRPRGHGAWPAHARAGNIALARMLRRRTGLRLHDLGPLRAARREGLLGLGLTDRRSGYPLQMVVRAADAGWRVAEHDVPYLPRTGVSKVTGTWRGTWQAVRDMRRVLAEPPTPPGVRARAAAQAQAQDGTAAQTQAQDGAAAQASAQDAAAAQAPAQDGTSAQTQGPDGTTAQSSAQDGTSAQGQAQDGGAAQPQAQDGSAAQPQAQVPAAAQTPAPPPPSAPAPAPASALAPSRGGTVQ